MRGYSINENVSSEGASTLSTFSVGINENVVLKKVSYGLASLKEDADPNGPKALMFEFEDANNNQFRHTEWEINDQRETESAEKLYDVLVNRGQTPKETKAEFVNNTVDKKYNQQATRIKHIMTKYMSEDETVIPPCNSFGQFANMVAKMLTPSIDGRKLRLLCVYNYKGYVTLPSFVPFAEQMIDGVATSLKITQYHKMTAPQPENTTFAVKSAISDNDEF